MRREKEKRNPFVFKLNIKELESNFCRTLWWNQNGNDPWHEVLQIESKACPLKPAQDEHVKISKCGTVLKYAFGGLILSTESSIVRRTPAVMHAFAALNMQVRHKHSLLTLGRVQSFSCRNFITLCLSGIYFCASKPPRTFRITQNWYTRRSLATFKWRVCLTV